MPTWNSKDRTIPFDIAPEALDTLALSLDMALDKLPAGSLSVGGAESVVDKLTKEVLARYLEEQPAQKAAARVQQELTRQLSKLGTITDSPRQALRGQIRSFVAAEVHTFQDRRALRAALFTIIIRELNSFPLSGGESECEEVARHIRTILDNAVGDAVRNRAFPGHTSTALPFHQGLFEALRPFVAVELDATAKPIDARKLAKVEQRVTSAIDRVVRQCASSIYGIGQSHSDLSTLQHSDAERTARAAALNLLREGRTIASPKSYINTAVRNLVRKRREFDRRHCPLPESDRSEGSDSGPGSVSRGYYLDPHIISQRFKENGFPLHSIKFSSDPPLPQTEVAKIVGKPDYYVSRQMKKEREKLSKRPADLEMWMEEARRRAG